MPKGDEVGGRGEIGGEGFQSVICVGKGRAIVIHGWFPLPVAGCDSIGSASAATLPASFFVAMILPFEFPSPEGNIGLMMQPEV
jgi:hypothetical protein